MRKPSENRKSPGSIAQWNKRYIRAASGQAREMQVPCGSCNACCRNPGLVVNLLPGEEQTYPDAVWNGDAKRWELPKRDNGECVYLENGRCSIYGNRPYSCRTYDCRSYLVGINPTTEVDRGLALEALERWGEWRLDTPQDLDTLFAWHCAFAEARQQIGSGPCQARSFAAKVVWFFRSLLPYAHEMRRIVGPKKARTLAKQDRCFRENLAHVYKSMLKHKVPKEVAE